MLLLAACQPEQPLPDYVAAPEFALTDQAGRRFGSADLAGRVALINFFYTTCRDTCPAAMAVMGTVQSRLRAEALLDSRVQLVSITVDPGRDTPEVLATYAQRYGADAAGWRLLTGDAESIYSVLEGFRVNTREVARAYAGAEVIPYSSRFMLVDAHGRIRAAMTGEEQSPDQIVQAIKRVLPP